MIINKKKYCRVQNKKQLINLLKRLKRKKLNIWNQNQKRNNLVKIKNIRIFFQIKKKKKKPLII